MASEWHRLLDEYNRVYYGEFRNENDREEALLDQMAFTMQKILEKLKEAEGLA